MDFGVVRCPRGEALADRLKRLHDGVREVVDRLRPDEAAVESVFTAKSPRSALTLGQARGAVLVAASGLPLAEYAPRAVKAALTGYGAADKPAVARMVARRLRLDRTPEPEDAADALAVAVAHLDARRAAARVARARSPAAGAVGARAGSAR